MSLLCSCAGKRRKKDKDDYYCKSRTPPPSIAPTPKVKRKFPEGVVVLPSVPSDLEETVLKDVGEIPSVSEDVQQAMDVTQLEESLNSSDLGEAIVIVSQQERIGSGEVPIVSASLQMTLKVTRQEINGSTNSLENTVKVTDHNTQPETELHASNEQTNEGHDGVISEPLYTKEILRTTRIGSDSNEEQKNSVASQVSTIQQFSCGGDDPSNFETNDESLDITRQEDNELLLTTNKEFPTTAEGINKYEDDVNASKNTRSQGGDLLNRMKEFFTPRQATKLPKIETEACNKKDVLLCNKLYRTEFNYVNSSNPLESNTASVSTPCSTSLYSSECSGNSFKQDQEAVNVQTQCDFSDFEDDNEDLLCFQEEEEYLNQLSDIKSKPPSIWDDADASSLKSSELFDVIQGEVDCYPCSKKNNTQNDHIFLKSDTIWQDIKETLLTLINDKDSELLQELKSPLENVPDLDYMSLQGQIDYDKPTLNLTGKDEYRIIPSKDVRAICQHIDEYFAAQKRYEDNLEDFSQNNFPSEEVPSEEDLSFIASLIRNNDITSLHTDNNICLRTNSLRTLSELKQNASCAENAYLKTTSLTQLDVNNSTFGITSTGIKNTLSKESTDVDEIKEDIIIVEVPKNKKDILSETLPNFRDSENLNLTNNPDQTTIENETTKVDNVAEMARKLVDGTTIENESTKMDNVAEMARKPVDETDSLEYDDESTCEDLGQNMMALQKSSVEPPVLEMRGINKVQFKTPLEEAPLKLHKNNIGNHLYDNFQMHMGILMSQAVPKSALSQDTTHNSNKPVCLEIPKEYFRLPRFAGEEYLDTIDSDIICDNPDDVLLTELSDNEVIPVITQQLVCDDIDIHVSDTVPPNLVRLYQNWGIIKDVPSPCNNNKTTSRLCRSNIDVCDNLQVNENSNETDNGYLSLNKSNIHISQSANDISNAGNEKSSQFCRDSSNTSDNITALAQVSSDPLDKGSVQDTEKQLLGAVDNVHEKMIEEVQRAPQCEEIPTDALDLAQNSNVQDAFVIAVEQQARERLERLSALKRIKPVDMTKLSQQLNQQIPATEQQQELNGFIESSPIYVTSIPPSAGAAPSKTVEPVGQQRRLPTAGRGAGVAVKVTPGGGSTPTATAPTTTTTTTTTNGHASSVEEPDSAEIELKQELVTDEDKEEQEEPQPAPVPAPSGSPFANGRTEVLIGQDEVGSRVRTTAIVESSKLAVGEDVCPRPRRRSGSSIVVVDTGQEPAKQPEPAGDALDMMMMTLDNGPHREMAVDVPASFIARSKTPPRYPPPRPRVPQQPPAPKPVPPPRDHLRIERDGRLVNRAPAPQVPARTPVHNNNNNTDREPTKEQLDSIRKFQEALRKRKEDEDRVAQQNEFLNSSLRGSRKLQALESHPPPSGVVNDGYSSAEEAELESRGQETLRRVIGYGELVASLQRLQLQLKKSSLGQGGYSSLEGQLAAVQTLLLSPQFGRALAVHNKVQQVWHGQVAPPTSAHAQSLVRDCLDTLQPCSLAGAAELADLLTRYEIEGLLHAHDAIAAATTPSGMTVGSPAEEEEEEAPEQLTGSNNIRIIKIEKTNEPLGATVRNEGDAVIIGRIVRGGAAEKSGLLHEGDEVLEVNGIEMRGKSVNDVCDILSGMTGTLTFLIVPESTAQPLPPTTRDTLLHMKAHFDYDPEEDLYIPCRELGISFQKGDVLHVISQDDPNWWQAYREGEEDQTLAGLIPSRGFQHQRESMKQTIAGDKVTKEKSKKAGTLLCAKKNPKKKKKKLPYNAVYNDGSYPLYATSTVDDYDAEEILTYEEVSLYYPRANHKRPIVLIGPPNIGRHELRQRLMEDAERFAAAIPHTSRSRKDGEVDGQDYHFITRAQFESDILARKFVEHGEYEKAYYGTSLDAIRSVVNSGKICVLNLHPQSLKILRSSDLKPYVVFVAPPSLEKLRQKKMRNSEAYKEDELKDIIEKAREMEDKYGHYFDMIIINNDTDRAYHQLLNEINSLEREPQWVPASWVKSS